MHGHELHLVPKRHLLHASDSGLMAHVKAGNHNALAVLCDRHQEQSYFVAYRLLGDREEAEDTVQDAFMNVWKGASGYSRQKGSALNWLLGAVSNRAIDRLRSREVRRRTIEKIVKVVPSSQPDEAFSELWRKVRLETQREQIREAVGTLPASQREILTLTHFEGLTQQEIAARLQLPLGTVKGRVRSALRKLRLHLEVESAV